jgi:hypothetical protein
MNNKQKEQFQILSETMDNQEKFFIELAAGEKSTGNVPAKYEADKRVMLAYQDWKTFGSWRHRPKVIEKLRKAAKKAAKNNT